jgi:site-specific DNA recombinase
LQDIESSKVDTIVVYKVDRLTRSLADFAKIVEALDARGVSFVSVTQQFNTTSSMGRLTLNVLLSFAQFEREVTGERIRDKIAASKRKGMWMGGTVPLGYDLKERKLVVNSGEARIVRDIFDLYLKLGCVSKLKRQLDREGTKSKTRTSLAGNHSGGSAYSRGALYQILRNRVYIGEIPHKAESYPGQHEAIVPAEIWLPVQAKLSSDHQGRKTGTSANSPSLLVGLLQDPEGNRFTPSHTTKNGRRYRYYVCQAASSDSRTPNKPARIPAHDLEQQVSLRLRSFLESPQDVMDGLTGEGNTPELREKLLESAREWAREWGTTSPIAAGEFLRAVIARVVVHPEKIEMDLDRKALIAALSGERTNSRALGDEERGIDEEQGINKDGSDVIRLEVQARVKRSGGEMRLVLSPNSQRQEQSRPVSSLLKAVARGRQWYEQILAEEVSSQRAIAQRLGVSERYVGRILECAFLAPDIVDAILEGQQPSHLTFDKLTRKLSVSWVEQREQLGFPAPRHSLFSTSN